MPVTSKVALIPKELDPTDAADFEKFLLLGEARLFLMPDGKELDVTVSREVRKRSRYLRRRANRTPALHGNCLPRADHTPPSLWWGRDPPPSLRWGRDPPPSLRSPRGGETTPRGLAVFAPNISHMFTPLRASK